MAQATADNKDVITSYIPPMSVMDAIYTRRAVRSYKPEPVSDKNIKTLLSAAVQAPTAIHEEPWAFVVIQDRALLKELSDSARQFIDSETRRRLPDLFRNPDFNIFYNAGTLIAIYGKPMGPFVAADCWLAAENLMLAACAMAMGSCVIGFAIQTLNTPEWKSKLGVPAGMTAYVSVIIGFPEGQTPPVPRKEPQIIAWK